MTNEQPAGGADEAREVGEVRPKISINNEQRAWLETLEQQRP